MSMGLPRILLELLDEETQPLLAYLWAQIKQLHKSNLRNINFKEVLARIFGVNVDNDIQTSITQLGFWVLLKLFDFCNEIQLQ